MTALLVIASTIDALLAVLLIAVSGFVFGGGPEGGHGELSGVVIWGLGLVLCVTAPMAGFILRSLGRVGAGTVVAWLPPAGALLITFAPYHPY